MSQELYKRYRPVTLKAVYGQEAAVKSISSLLERDAVPHTILLSGPSGCGKTTIARILKTHLECVDIDFTEINCADFKGIEMVRDIRRSLPMKPMSGGTRVWLIDEAHKLTGDAQNALLKMLEDTPEHAYFMLATTDPQKLLKTILTRCFEVKLKAMTADAQVKLLKRVCKRESIVIDEDVETELVEAAEGSARKLLVMLEQIAYIESKEEQVAAIQATSLTKGSAYKLASSLVYGRPAWAEVASLLKEVEAEEPETIRYLVLSLARGAMLKGGKVGERGFLVADVFRFNFYDSKKAGLVHACWEVIHAGK